MFGGFSRRATMGCALIAGATLVASQAQAVTFLGLDSDDGHQIDNIGFLIQGDCGGGSDGCGVFVDSTDELDIAAEAANIDATPTTPPGPVEVLTEISGGIIDVNLDITSETVQHFGGGFFEYQAIFSGRAGETDVSLFAPTGGPAPEQDGRLLISGEITTTAVFSIFFSPAGGITSLSFNGDFTVTGGDATFQDVFGDDGDLATIVGSVITSNPTTNALLADGYVFSDRDDGSGGNELTACAAAFPGGGFCSGVVTGQTADFDFEGNGEIIPDFSPAFVPEPGTAMLVGIGLVGLASRKNRS